MSERIIYFLVIDKYALFFAKVSYLLLFYGSVVSDGKLFAKLKYIWKQKNNNKIVFHIFANINSKRSRQSILLENCRFQWPIFCKIWYIKRKLFKNRTRTATRCGKLPNARTATHNTPMRWSYTTVIYEGLQCTSNFAALQFVWIISANVVPLWHRVSPKHPQDVFREGEREITKTPNDTLPRGDPARDQNERISKREMGRGMRGKEKESGEM